MRGSDDESLLTSGQRPSACIDTCMIYGYLHVLALFFLSRVSSDGL